MQLTFKDYSTLFEARKPDLKYTEVKVKENIARVVVELEAQQSSAMTKLARNYMQLDRAVKTLSDRRNATNEALTDKVAEFFDEATDKVYTRVINTVSFTLTLAKQTPPVDKTAVDYEKICAELKELISEDLLEQVKAIEEKYTVVTPASKQKEKKPGLSVDVNKTIKESFVGDISAKLKQVLTMFLAKINAWAKSYDKKLAALEKQLA